MKCEFLEGLSSLCLSLLFCMILVMPASIVGCAEKEKVVDIETPAGEVEVERNLDTGAAEVDVTRNPANDDAATQPAPVP